MLRKFTSLFSGQKNQFDQTSLLSNETELRQQDLNSLLIPFKDQANAKQNIKMYYEFLNSQPHLNENTKLQLKVLILFHLLMQEAEVGHKVAKQFTKQQLNFINNAQKTDWTQQNITIPYFQYLFRYASNWALLNPVHGDETNTFAYFTLSNLANLGLSFITTLTKAQITNEIYPMVKKLALIMYIEIEKTYKRIIKRFYQQLKNLNGLGPSIIELNELYLQAQTLEVKMLQFYSYIVHLKESKVLLPPVSINIAQPVRDELKRLTDVELDKKKKPNEKKSALQIQLYAEPLKYQFSIHSAKASTAGLRLNLENIERPEKEIHTHRHERRTIDFDKYRHPPEKSHRQNTIQELEVQDDKIDTEDRDLEAQQESHIKVIQIEALDQEVQASDDRENLEDQEIYPQNQFIQNLHEYVNDVDADDQNNNKVLEKQDIKEQGELRDHQAEQFDFQSNESDKEQEKIDLQENQNQVIQQEDLQTNEQQVQQHENQDPDNQENPDELVQIKEEGQEDDTENELKETIQILEQNEYNEIIPQQDDIQKAMEEIQEVDDVKEENNNQEQENQSPQQENIIKEDNSQVEMNEDVQQQQQDQNQNENEDQQIVIEQDKKEEEAQDDNNPQSENTIDQSKQQDQTQNENPQEQTQDKKQEDSAKELNQINDDVTNEQSQENQQDNNNNDQGQEQDQQQAHQQQDQEQSQEQQQQDVQSEEDHQINTIAEVQDDHPADQINTQQFEQIEEVQRHDFSDQLNTDEEILKQIENPDQLDQAHLHSDSSGLLERNDIDE